MKTRSKSKMIRKRNRVKFKLFSSVLCTFARALNNKRNLRNKIGFYERRTKKIEERLVTVTEGLKRHCPHVYVNNDCWWSSSITCRICCYELRQLN